MRDPKPIPLYTIEEPVSNPPELIRKRGGGSPSKHDKLYRLIATMSSDKWIPVSCPDGKSMKKLVSNVRCYFHKKRQRVETRFDYDNNKVYMKLIREE